MVTDLHRLLLGMDDMSPTLDAVEQVVLTSEASQYVSRLLSLPNVRRGGPLMGHRTGMQIEVTHFLAGGLPWRVGHPLMIDALYLLGALDALTQHAPLDWVGYWVTDEQPADLELAREWRWMTATHPLLTLTYTPERPIIRAYSGGEETTELPCY